ncbi:MAG: guanylate kinase [Ectothiorhodospiraceae bacterium]|nr:guanylate kinase [Ectothiorhodospiraceae bacterium]
MLIVLSAPSGAGKTTIAKAIMQQMENLYFSVSATTRPKRKNEEEGTDYFFLTHEEFQWKIRNEELVEFEEIFGNYYGTLKSTIDEALEKGDSLIFDIDVKGAVSIKRLYPDDCVSIFIMPPDLDTLRERIVGRDSDGEREIETRMARAQYEIDQKSEFDHVVVNDNLEHAIDEVKKILQDERKKRTNS